MRRSPSKSRREAPVSTLSLLKSALAFPLAGSLPALAGHAEAAPRPPTGRKIHVAVIGAGAFGGWTAYNLLRRGARVTLLDAWGPGNARSSSGGDTRVMRSLYGPLEMMTDMAVRALELWREHETRWQRRLYHRTGSLILGEKGHWLIQGSIEVARKRRLEVRELTVDEARRRYPQVRFEGDEWILIDSDTGYLRAREACRVVLEHFVDEGGEYRQAKVRPGPIEAAAMAHRSSSIAADRARRAWFRHSSKLRPCSRLPAFGDRSFVARLTSSWPTWQPEGRKPLPVSDFVNNLCRR